MFLLGILPLLIVGISDLKKPKINKIKKYNGVVSKESKQDE